MTAMDRLRTELAFHDAQALTRRRYFAEHPEALQVDDDRYLEHESWIRPAIELLGPVRGQSILDYGCGHGMASVVLTRRGAQVTAFDLSPWYVAEAQERAQVNAVGDAIEFVQASAEDLPFADRAFDGVWGHAILHHLDLGQAAAELARVLKPGGLAVFCEPWGENPLLEWARRRLPYTGKQRSPDEQPLRRRDLTILRRHFREVSCQPYQLLTMVRRVWPTMPLRGPLQTCDRALLARWPSLGRFCRYMVLSLRR
jgi:SAM-dependent methyltransferase